MIKGMQQVLPYNSATGKLWFVSTDENGEQIKPDSAPTIAVYDPSGTVLVAATNMTAKTVTDIGWLNYDAMTAKFSNGCTVTDGTSGATAVIISQKRAGTTGKLYLGDVSGTFGNNNAITDSDGGAAAVDGTIYSCEYYYTCTTVATTSFEVAQNYYALITNTVGSAAYKHYLYFDVAFFPATKAWVTSEDVARQYPSIALPNEWTDFQPAIDAAHAALVRQLHSLGEEAAHLVKRDQEMWGIEMAYIRAELARSLGEASDTVKYWDANAAAAWAGRGNFTHDSDDEADLDEDQVVISSGFTR